MFPCVTGAGIVWGRASALAVQLPDKEARVPGRTGSPEPASHLVPGPQGEPRWQGSLAQVCRHLSAGPRRDEPQVTFPLCLLKQRDHGVRGRGEAKRGHPGRLLTPF